MGPATISSALIQERDKNLGTFSRSSSSPVKCLSLRKRNDVSCLSVLVLSFLICSKITYLEGVFALSATSITNPSSEIDNILGYDLSIPQARDKFENWRNSNPHIDSTREFTVRREDLYDGSIKITDRDSRVSHFATKIFSDSLQTSNAANLACRSGALMVNRTKVSGGRRVQIGDIISYKNDGLDRRTAIPEDPQRAERFCASRARLLRTLADSELSHSPLRVLYEDQCMAIVCKPAGIHTMSWSGSLGKSLCLDEILPLVLSPPVTLDLDDESLLAPLPRHRLDQRVAGPVVVAKTRKACVHIGRSFEEKTVQKEYRAIVVGNVTIDTVAKETKDGTVRNLSADSNAPLSFTIHSIVDDKPSETEVVVMGSTNCNVNGVLTDLKLFPKTGRKHQLRIHCAKVLGTPILGDDLYWEVEQQGGRAVRRRQGLYLYCKKVSLGHPRIKDAIVSAEIDEPLRFARTREKALKGFEWSRLRGQSDC